MISNPPRPDETDEPDTPPDVTIGAGWTEEGSAGRSGIDADEVDRASRTYWEAEADAYQAEHGAFLAGRPTVTSAVASPSGADSVREVNGIHGTPTGVGVLGDAGSDASGDVTGGGFVWGPEGLTEAEAGLLGPIVGLAGTRVLEVGCGAAQCSRWLAEQGVRAVGIDIAIAQLRHAAPPAPPPNPPTSPAATELTPPATPPHADPAGSRRVSADRVRPDPTRSGVGPSKPDAIQNGAAVDADLAAGGPGRGGVGVVAATATALPFGDASFDVAFASYGAIQFVGDLPLLFREVRRVLRPGGRWVFSVTHPIRWAFPDDPGPAGLSASGSYFDRTPYVERDGTGAAVYAEFHRTIGDYVTALVGAGFAIETIVEPEWPEWNHATWGGWSPLRGTHLPGTLIIGCRADGGAGARPPG